MDTDIYTALPLNVAVLVIQQLLRGRTILVFAEISTRRDHRAMSYNVVEDKLDCTLGPDSILAIQGK